MLIFAKDITLRSPVHPREGADPELGRYMEYQRQLFPYTIVRAGLDLAYKELDDILNYVDRGYQKPEGTQRESYPEDVPEWYQQRFPWAASFMDMEVLHGLLVHLIRAMDSFRTREAANTCHWAALYDAVHNIVRVYNELLAANPDSARDIHLSRGVEVDFDDFINNYWPHLEFMILSRPDYPHVVLLERNREIEQVLRSDLAAGLAPLAALEKAAARFQWSRGTLALLRRDPLGPELAALETLPIEADPFKNVDLQDSDVEPQLTDAVAQAYETSFRHFRSGTAARS